jgi:NADH-quinone oxidoreductase subunit I
MLGIGIIQGLVETARNFFGSYTSKQRLTTVQFPDERLIQPEATRVFPFLVYDTDDWEQGLRCVACKICEVECPPQCISITKSADKKPDYSGIYSGKPQFYPEKFDIDVSVCMSCQICVEVCPFEAIKMDNAFELSTDDRFGGLLWQKERLAKPNSHYQKIHPTDAAESDAALAEKKAKAEAKPAAAAAAKPAPENAGAATER